MSIVGIVDDEENVLYSFTKGLSSSTVEVVTAGDGEEAIERFTQRPPDVVILDVRLPGMSGLEVFDRLREIDPRMPVIVVTAHGTTDTAINAMKRGALEYLVKPVDIHQLRRLVVQALEVSRMQDMPAAFEDDDYLSPHADRIIGRSEPMQQVYKTIGRVASEDISVLILGESGTGKELVARAIHHHSSRANQPLLSINCAALPEPLLESELFGHERGAFTGATQRRIGKFEQADGGTLFLDELGDMSPSTQAKILRVLQDGRFERLGGNETIEVDVRGIAATNQDLAAKIKTKEFRQDLLYRLNGFTVRLPPLRDRMDDLPLLVEHFMKLANQQVNNQAVCLSPAAMDVLMSHDWPGNVRELQSAVKYAVVHSVGHVITPECLPESCRATPSLDEQGTELDFPEVKDYLRRRLRAGDSDIYRSLADAIDRIAIEETLQHVANNQVQASERLGMSRTTLRSRIENFRRD